MSAPRPEVFVSATSADLRSIRQIVNSALLTIGCVPVEETNFSPAASTVRQMLRDKISKCSALVHVVGECYGSEPSERMPNEPRRSYTQLEYDIASELNKPVYVFVCGKDFPYDEHASEPEELRILQNAHRQRLQSGDHVFMQVGNRDELTKRVYSLQTRVETLEKDLSHSRKWLAWGVMSTVVILLIIGVAVWRIGIISEITSARLATVETKLDEQRHYIDLISLSYTRLQSELVQLKLTDEQLYERAIENVARDDKIPVEKLKGAIDLFVTAIRSDAQADYFDKARADFAQRNFVSAGENAGLAAKAARLQRLAAEKAAEQMHQQIKKSRDSERGALILQAQSLSANRQPDRVVAVLNDALSITPRIEDSQKWAELEDSLGTASVELARVSEGTDIEKHYTEAVAAYRAALEVRTRESLPQDWAMTQNNLGVVLSELARICKGADRTRLLNDAIAACRASLDVYTREGAPQDWAMVQNNLGNALVDQASTSEGEDQTLIRSEAIAIYLSVLEILTKEKLILDWAQTENNLGGALRAQALDSGGAHRSRFLDAAIFAYRAALTVFTRKEFPQDWATTQNNLGLALQFQAETKRGSERVKLLEEAEYAYRNVLEIRTRENAPQDWANAQFSLGFVIGQQTITNETPSRIHLLDEAVMACRNAQEVHTQLALPRNWAAEQIYLGLMFWQQALSKESSERKRLLTESVNASRNVIDAFSREEEPQLWASAQDVLTLALSEKARICEGTEREKLADEAVEAAKNELDVFQQTPSTINWAEANYSLGYALYTQALSQDKDKAIPLLNESISFYRKSLEVFTPQDFPQAWAMTKNHLCLALSELALRSETADSVQILGEATTISQEVIRSVAREDSPMDWADAQNNLGELLFFLSQLGDSVNTIEFLNNSISAYRLSLLVRNYETFPFDNKITTDYLAEALGYLAWYYLFNERIKESVNAAQEACLLAHDDLWLLKILAHGCLLAGQYDKAVEIYRKHALEKLSKLDNNTFAQACLDDFSELRKAGIDTPDMAKVEAMIKAITDTSELQP